MKRFAFVVLAAASAIAIAACASNDQTAETGQGGPTRTAEKPDADIKDKEAVVVTGSRQAPKQSDGRADRLYAEAPPAPPPPPVATVAPSPAYRAAPSFGFDGGVAQSYPQPRPGDIDREKYEHKDINRVKLVAEEPVSTFSIDVDTAGYANVRRFLNQGVLPPKDAVRIEELVNYFDYDYALPDSKAVPFSTSVQIAPSPWGKGRELMRIGVQGYDIPRDHRPALNLTLLLDTSGSMNPEDRLPLAIKSLKLLIDQLGKDDHVSIVAYAGSAGEVLAPTSGAEKGKIVAALDRLHAGGSTAGGEGLRLAYDLARQNYDKTSVNRVMLMTDGDFNVGINDPERLKDFITRERESGIYLSVIGFGHANYNDALMQKLAQNGNGIAAYVDTLNEGRKVFADDFSGSMFTIANDVKIQVEFNPAKVAEYRLIGYETRILNREDFNNDKVDAGDIGAGASVTAIYELTPVGSSAKLVDASRYAAAQKVSTESKGSEFAYLKMRYKLPGQDTSRLIERPIDAKDEVSDISKAGEATRFATAVAGYGELLRGDPYLDKSFTWDSVIDLANTAKGKDEFGYRAEFIQLARLAKTAASQATLKRPTLGE
jgi:Ca-activated chloride channel family protein